MHINYQAVLLDLVRIKLAPKESIGHALSEILNISTDASYRRLRGETHLTINELQKICEHYSISLDVIFGIQPNQVLFDYEPLENYSFNMENYLENLLNGLKRIAQYPDIRMLISINNTPFLQLLNFPYLVRFKLYFWAKTHLQVPEYKDQKFKHERFSDQAFDLGKQILQTYNRIPSRELYDPELLRGFAREVYYNYKAGYFEDPSYAIWLLNKLIEFVNHLQEQARLGKKFIYGTQAPETGNELELYHNETLNAITSIHYESKEASGLYLAHNFMNLLHSENPEYVKDSKAVLEKIISNSSVISYSNEKERHQYFSQVIRMIEQFKAKITSEINEQEIL